MLSSWEGQLTVGAALKIRIPLVKVTWKSLTKGAKQKWSMASSRVSAERRTQQRYSAFKTKSGCLFLHRNQTMLFDGKWKLFVGIVSWTNHGCCHQVQVIATSKMQTFVFCISQESLAELTPQSPNPEYWGPCREAMAMNLTVFGITWLTEPTTYQSQSRHSKG